MATNDSFEFDYVPGFTKPTHEYGQEFGDEFHAPRVKELLLSTARFTQFGVTLAGNQGVLPTGCAIAQQTANKKYYLYNASASDGTQYVVGFLRDARDTGGSASPAGKPSTDCLGNVVVGGILDLTLLSGTDTTSLAAAAAGGIGSGATGVITQLKARLQSGPTGASGNINAFYF
jgi:hypothetical protein